MVSAVLATEQDIDPTEEFLVTLTTYCRVPGGIMVTASCLYLTN